MLVVSGVEKSVAVTGSEATSITSESAGHSVQLSKRPVVASGVRQAAFEAEAQMNHKSASRSSARTPSIVRGDDNGDNGTSASPPVVDKGASVTVHAITAGVRVTTSGKALEPGTTGETIPVELADSKQHVQARIVGPQTVEIATGAAATPRQ